jgi:hypothetical protein
MKRNRRLLPSLGLLIALSLFPSAALARDRGFGAVVRAVENTYHLRRSNRLVCWFAGVAVKFAKPEGIEHLRLAMFEDQGFSPRSNDADFEEAVRSALTVDWQPIVRVWSRRDGERTHIYARRDSNDVSLFIVSVEEDEAVVMEVKMDEKAFAEMIDSPERAADAFRVNSEDDSREPVGSPRPALQPSNSFTAENR